MRPSIQSRQYRSPAWSQDPRGYVRGKVCTRCGFDYPSYYLSDGVCLDCAPTGRLESPTAKRIEPQPRAEPEQPIAPAAMILGLSLKPAQRAVFIQLSQGVGIRETARRLGIAPSTVHRTAERIGRRIGKALTPRRAAPQKRRN